MACAQRGQFMSRNLNRRLRKLEAQLTDSSGLVAGSPAWWKFWMAEAERTLETDYEPHTGA